MNEIHAENSQRLLLPRRGRVKQMSVENDLRGHLMRVGLEADAKPSPSIAGIFEAARSDSIRECEESLLITAACIQLLQNLTKFLLQHSLQPLAADISLGMAVDGIAYPHVVRRYGFRHRSRGAADGKEPAGHLLTSADFGERAIGRRIEIDLERFFARAGW